MKISTIAIIGCGGLAAHILPALCTTYNLVLVDGDTYEPKNTIRQLAAHVGDGKNKAETLRDIYAGMTDKTITAIPQYLTPEMELPHCDLMLVAVDNHDARLIAKTHANKLFIPLIWGANEAYDPQAFLYRPEDKDSHRDPFIRMNIQPDGRGPGSSCTTPEAVAETPQLPIANNVAGGFTLMLMHSLESVTNPENLLAQIIGVANSVQSARFKDLVATPVPETHEAVLS